jgi:hypothetical protein
MSIARKIRARATYANVTATLALFIALGGTSFAVTKLSGSEKTVVKKIAKKQANKRITARAPKLSVASAAIANPSGPAGGDLAGSYPNPSIADNAITSAKVQDFGLRLSDMGGLDNNATSTVSTTTPVPAGECVQFQLTTVNPAPAGLIGSLVVGFLTTANGGAVLDNSGIVLPTMVSETSQDGAVENLMVCATSNQSVPAGSVFHYHLIGP